MSEIIMVVGGSSSGKSVFAEQLAGELSEVQKIPVRYLATGTIGDEEFARRVDRHRQRRPVSWNTIEEPCDLDLVLQSQEGEGKAIFLVDGIGTWVSNLMYQNNHQPFCWDEVKELSFTEQVERFIRSLDNIKGTLILVADEVGMDVVPASQEGRIFRDLNGQTNQALAKRSDRVYLLSCGIPIQIKG